MIMSTGRNIPAARYAPKPRWRLTHYLLQSACVLLAACLLMGCPPSPPSDSHRIPTAQVGAAPVLGTPSFNGTAFAIVPKEPLSGDALAKARLDRKAIADLVHREVAPPSTQPTTAPARPTNAEAPPLAVKYYLQGREKFLDGANSEAMDDLEKSLKLDPDAFTVLRLMGRVCFSANQLARGSYYLKRAQALHPADVEVNYFLGRFYIEAAEWPKAIHYLILADESPERSPTMAFSPLVSFYLARSLQGAGYHVAAARQYEDFLNLIVQPVAAYRFDRELAYLAGEQWAANLEAADNLAIAGEYTKAVPHYEQAALGQPKDHYIAGRLINALALSGDATGATAKALRLVLDSDGDSDAITLLLWSYKATGREPHLLTELRLELAGQQDRAAASEILALVLERMGRSSEASTALRAALKTDPANLVLLKAALARLEKADDYPQALEITSAALTAAPDKHDDIMELFVPLMDVPSAPRQIVSLPPSAGAAQRYLLARTLARHDAAPAAITEQFAAAMKADPSFLPAREAYIRALLGDEQFTKADQAITQAIASGKGAEKALELQIESEIVQNRFTKAVQVAREAKGKFPRSPELRMTLASIYRLRDQDRDADAELFAAVEEFPKFEPAYRRLIDSYLERSHAADGGDRYLNDAIALVGRLVREVPTSHYAQTITALLYARTGEWQQSEDYYRRLFEESPTDPSVAVPFSEVLVHQNKRDEAEKVLQQSLTKKPQVAIATNLADFYRELGRNADALAVSDNLMKRQPDNEIWLLLQVSELAAQQRQDDALKLLQQGAAKFPHSQNMATNYARQLATTNQAAEAVKFFQDFITRNGVNTDRLYVLANLQTQADDEPAAEVTLEKLLARMPDHTGANNDLGYYWVDAGVKLDKAIEMIRSAVTNLPNNAAFLDSLGWAYYKKAQFKDAVRYLEEAIALPNGMDPELLSHLGDALYRSGKQDQAVERWTQAQALLSSESKGRTKTKQHVDEALRQVRDGKTPPLAPVGQGVVIEKNL